MRHAVARALSCVLCLASTGCPREGGTSSPAAATPEAPPTTNDPQPARCGPPGQRFDGIAFVPRTVRLAAVVDVASPELDDALAALAEAADRGAPLPIDVAFATRQWSWEIPFVLRTLDDAGFEPAELLRVRTEDRLVAWMWPMRCDLAQARESVEARWGVRTRSSVNAVIGTPTETSAFAFDVVFLEGEVGALVPRTRGAALLEDLAEPGPSYGALGGDTRPTGALIEVMEPAVIRMVVRGPSLVAGTGGAQGGEGLVRVTAAGVEFGGSLAPDP